jgi:hypothetical protein
MPGRSFFDSYSILKRRNKMYSFLDITLILQICNWRKIKLLAAKRSDRFFKADDYFIQNFTFEDSGEATMATSIDKSLLN